MRGPHTVRAAVIDPIFPVSKEPKDATSPSIEVLQAVRISLGFRILDAATAAALAPRGSAARRRLSRLGAEALGSRKQPSDADLPFLHAGRRRGAGLLSRQVRPRVQADRSQDDADRVLQH